MTASSLDRSLRRSLTAGRTASGSSPTARQLLRCESSGECMHPGRTAAQFARRLNDVGTKGSPPRCKPRGCAHQDTALGGLRTLC